MNTKELLKKTKEEWDELVKQFDDWFETNYPKLYSNLQRLSWRYKEIKTDIKYTYRSFNVWLRMVKFGRINYEFNGDDWLYFVKSHLQGTLKWMNKNKNQPPQVIANIKRCIEIIDNIEKDNYAYKFGYKDFPIVIKPIKGSELFSLESQATENQKKLNLYAIRKGEELRQSEWEELGKLLFGDKNIEYSDCRTWWD